LGKEIGDWRLVTRKGKIEQIP